MYKGYKYHKDNDGLWKVFLSGEDVFVIALDDSKSEGMRKINWKNNSELACKKFIDWKENTNK